MVSLLSLFGSSVERADMSFQGHDLYLGDEDMGEVKFTGDPPYELPIAQNVEVEAVDTIVQVTLRVSMSRKRPDPAPIRVRFPLPVAQALLSKLKVHVFRAERNARRSTRQS